MEWYNIVLICVGAAVALLAAFGLIIYRVAFGGRCDRNPLLQYFSAQDFELTTQTFNISKKKYELCGKIYTKQSVPDKNVLVAFCHGLGAGHAAYMTEIAYLCNKGYTVMALDNRGCDLSGGKSIKGMYSGVSAAKDAIDYARGEGRFKDYKLCLMGHSWGGYSALCASAERKVDAVVAISAPVSPAKTVCYAAAQIIPKAAVVILKPFIAFADFLHFGLKSNKNAAKCAVKSGAPTLLVQGDKDSVVPLEKSAYAFADGANVKKYLAEGKSHNPYNSPEAQQMMIELSAKLAQANKMSEEEKQYFYDFDYVAATEEDEEVMRKINEFLSVK